MGDASFETFFVVGQKNRPSRLESGMARKQFYDTQNPRNQGAFRGFQALMPIQLPSCSSINQITQVRFCEALGDWP